MTPSQEPDKQRALGTSGADRDEDWSQRCGRLFEEMRRPARAMVARAYGRALSDEEIEDVYSAAWTATLSALRERGRRMQEGELRAYILTAVASHASKEMRRRSRKPLHPLEADREQIAFDGHAPLPDELAIGSESRGMARDLLTSLPVRRRAVMLLRYGWGLSPGEVCALVPGLSPRAYRKEITRGVEDLMAGLGKVESGEWCAEREPLIRVLVAGTADDSARRQATEHLQHCRACSELATRLSQQLHEIGSVIALSTVAGSIGGAGLPLLERIGELVGGIRSAATNAAERAESALTTLAASGGAKGSGAAGAGIAAKLAGAGGAVKAAVACIGASAAATACVAAGVVPGVSLPGLDPDAERHAVASEVSMVAERPTKTRAAIASVIDVSHAVEHEGTRDPEPSPTVPPPAAPPPPDIPPVQEGEPAGQPVVSAPVEEFDPVAAAAPAPAPTPSGSSSSGDSSGASAAQNEFGP